MCKGEQSIRDIRFNRTRTVSCQVVPPPSRDTTGNKYLNIPSHAHSVCTPTDMTDCGLSKLYFALSRKACFVSRQYVFIFVFFSTWPQYYYYYYNYHHPYHSPSLVHFSGHISIKLPKQIVQIYLLKIIWPLQLANWTANFTRHNCHFICLIQQALTTKHVNQNRWSNCIP